MTIEAVSVVGLGKLGLPLAAALGSRGLQVIGVDRDKRTVEAVKGGWAPFHEPGLNEMLPLLATTDAAQAVQYSDATFVIVNTPSRSDGSFALDNVLAACEAVGAVLRDKERFHLVVISSTVMPGACGGPIKRALEASSGKAVGEGFGLACVPEFVALGEVLKGFLQPAFVLIGADDPTSKALAHGLYRRFVGRKPVIYMTSLVNAELAKIALNCFLTTKISYGNQLAGICERIPGANAEAVVNLLGMDPRINAAYMWPGAPYGGPCFPRDDRALVALARGVGSDATLAQAASDFNHKHLHKLAALVTKAATCAGRTGRVGLLGLAFKPGTDCGTDSPSLALLDELEALRPVGYDPLLKRPGDPQTAQGLADEVDVVVVMTRDPAWREVAFREGQKVVDCWRWLRRDEVEAAGARYIGLGVGG